MLLTSQDHENIFISWHVRPLKLDFTLIPNALVSSNPLCISAVLHFFTNLLRNFQLQTLPALLFSTNLSFHALCSLSPLITQNHEQETENTKVPIKNPSHLTYHVPYCEHQNSNKPQKLNSPKLEDLKFCELFYILIYLLKIKYSDKVKSKSVCTVGWEQGGVLGLGSQFPVGHRAAGILGRQFLLFILKEPFQTQEYF